MKIEVREFRDDSGDNVLLIYVDHNGNSSCDEVDSILVDESFEIDGEPCYLQVWNQVCEDIFGSWVIRTKRIQSGNWALFYPLSKISFIAKMQKSHFNFTANMATLEMERITKLLNKKYGEQLILDMRENC